MNVIAAKHPPQSSHDRILRELASCTTWTARARQLSYIPDEFKPRRLEDYGRIGALQGHINNDGNAISGHRGQLSDGLTFNSS